MSESDSMLAWLVQANGGPERLGLEAAPVPTPRAGQALVRVVAAGLNYSDVLMVRGAYQIRPPLPFTPGQEIAGLVSRAAPDCALRDGERVTCKVAWGGFAPFALIDGDHAIRIPDGLSFEDALVLPVIAVTAWIALHHRARLQSGETVLVHAGAGALGLAAIRIAVAAGARVFATVGDESKAAACLEAGAERVFNYGAAQPWEQAVIDASGAGGVDVVLDSVGGSITDGSIRCLAREGRLLVAGFSSGEIPSIRANRLLLRNIAALGVYWRHEDDATLVAGALAAIIDAWRRDLLALRAGTVYPYASLPGALADLAGRRTIGKCVLQVSSP